ncbi:MAG TPA: 50S ribosomal protein L1 [Gemmataceae bacterium]|jgi:large subunit ribosomal protein L1|nr:50S ribosomal protein L1 [Gemmataceae bacterium]
MTKKQTAPEGAEAKPAEAAAPAAAGASKGKKKPAKTEPAPAAPAAEGAAPAEAAAPAAAAASGERTAGKKKKPGIPPARGKKLRNLLKQQRSKLSKETSPLKKAMTILKGLKRAKFDETVEVHMSLGVDTTQSDQLVRGTVPLPHGVGKTVRVIVFCQGENVGKAKEAGADFAGAEDLIEKITKQNWLEFDVALATQDMMGKVSRIAKVLGPRGLMPTPKSGTVVTGDVAQAVKDFKAGKVEYRTDKGGNVHAGVGKISFDENKLVENATAFIEAVRAAKPSGVKGHFVQSITICSTMSPGVPISIT